MNAVLTDGLAAAERLLLKLRHDPAAIVLTLGAPVALVVIFGYIFGSAISVPGGDYRAYLVSGLLRHDRGQHRAVDGRGGPRQHKGSGGPFPVVAHHPFGRTFRTGRGYGAVRTRELPADGPVRPGRRLAGRPGRRRRGRGAGPAGRLPVRRDLGGIYLGLLIGKEETAAQASILVFPVTMLSNVFVPTAGMPAWLRAIADWNPVSALAAASRQLFGTPEGPAAPGRSRTR